MKKIVNCTRHIVRVVRDQDENGEWTTLDFLPSGMEARVGEVVGNNEVVVLDCETTFVQEWSFGEVLDLPAPQDNTLFIVSAMVISALREQGVRRDDLVSPLTDKTAIRKDGQVWAVRGFRRQV